MDAHSLGLLPVKVHHRAIRGGCSKATVRVRGGSFATRRPVFAFPVDQMCGYIVGHTLPPDVTVVCERDIGKNSIF